MSRYIDVENIRTLFNDEYKKTLELIQQGETHLDNLAEGFKEASDIIMQLPTADVKEVVHGEWKSAGCNKCGRTLHEIIDGDSYLDSYYEEFGTPFCPFCGADLRGE